MATLKCSSYVYMVNSEVFSSDGHLQVFYVLAIVTLKCMFASFGNSQVF